MPQARSPSFERRDYELEITDNLEDLLAVLPPHLSQAITTVGPSHGTGSLIEIVMDLGRRPEARFHDGEVELAEREVSRDDLAFVAERIGRFGDDNRAGIERTLHRISAIRNRVGDIVGLTCRIGRAVYGTIAIIRDLIESGESILLLGKPGVGKCVTGDSLVLTTDGLRPLAKLVPDDLATDRFALIDAVVYGRNGLEPASHAYNGGRVPTRRIVTSQGFALEGTPEHPVLALAETGQLVFRRLDQLLPGDFVAIQRGQQVFGHETRLPNFAFVPRTNALDGSLPSELTTDLARFLGYLVAEGTLSFANQVALSHTDPEIQSDMVSLADRLFGLRLRPHLHRGQWNSKDFRLFGVKLRRFLAHLGLAQSKAADKRIPPCVLSAPKPIVTAFLRALYEGDGSVYGPHGRVEIASASQELIAQLHVLLLNYGIVGCRRVKHNSAYDRDYFALTLIGENVVRFADEIGFLSATKQTKLARYVSSIKAAGHNPNLDVVPQQNQRLRQLRGLVGVGSQALARFSRLDDRAPSYRSLERILVEAQTAVAEPVYQELATIAQARYFFDPVKRVEVGEAPVFDLSVPTSHSFFANGFVCHNTTMLRETARVLADELGKRVIIVDTSNEIAGDGDIPHPGIGRARRMQVPTPTAQHAVMIEAVENHMPEVVVIDEIGTELEALAARTIAERGVQLIGTAHGNSLENLMMNPTLSDLIGGIQSVTLSDEEARRRGTQKSILERKAPPTFGVMIEIVSRDEVAVHADVAVTVDAILRGVAPRLEHRRRDDDGRVAVAAVDPRAPAGPDRRAIVDITSRQSAREDAAPPALIPEPALDPSPPNTDARLPRGRGTGAKPLRVYPFGVSRNRLEQAIVQLGVPALVVRDQRDADLVMTLKNYYRRKPQPLREAETRGTPVYVLRANTATQMENVLGNLFPNLVAGADGPHQPPAAPPWRGVGGSVGADYPAQPEDPVVRAIAEAEDAITAVIDGAPPVALAPQESHVRRLQHQLAERYNVASRSRGREPNRRVEIFREGIQ